jgi:hypothetical protein
MEEIEKLTNNELDDTHKKKAKEEKKKEKSEHKKKVKNKRKDKEENNLEEKNEEKKEEKGKPRKKKEKKRKKRKKKKPKILEELDLTVFIDFNSKKIINETIKKSKLPRRTDGPIAKLVNIKNKVLKYKEKINRIANRKEK